MIGSQHDIRLVEKAENLCRWECFKCGLAENEIYNVTPCVPSEEQSKAQRDSTTKTGIVKRSSEKT